MSPEGYPAGSAVPVIHTVLSKQNTALLAHWVHASSPMVFGAGQEERGILVARSLPLQNHLCDSEARAGLGGQVAQ